MSVASFHMSRTMIAVAKSSLSSMARLAMYRVAAFVANYIHCQSSGWGQLPKPLNSAIN